MKIITLDFETYYSVEYSLSRMTTEEYVRGPEFEVIGVSVQEDDGEPVWFSGSMLQTEKFLTNCRVSANCTYCISDPRCSNIISDINIPAENFRILRVGNKSNWRSF